MKKNTGLIILGIIIGILGLSFCLMIYKSINLNKENNKLQAELEDIKKETDQESNVSEEELINHLDKLSNEINTITNKETVSKDEESAIKKFFVTLTDFLFYDGTIKGKKFSDLTTSAKEKIISIYENLDKKIENKFPNYKERIGTGSKNAYNNIKEKLAEVKEKVQFEYQNNVAVKESVAENKENINNVYNEYKPYLDSGKEKAKENYEKVKDNLNSKYQKYKES